MLSREEREAIEAFGREVGALRGDDLLARAVAFDALPKAAEGERDVRLGQDLALEAALTKEFGIGWKKKLDAYKARQP